MNEQYKERFVADFNLPINVFHDFQFNYLLNLYDSTYNSKQLYEFYKNTVQKYNNSEANFFKQYNILISKIREHLKFFDAFKVFNDSKISLDKILTRTTQLYVDKNKNKLYYSLDLKQANFHALKFVNPNLVMNCNTYEDFIKRFTHDDYIIQSKNFRMLIFKPLSISNVLKVERKILNELLTVVLKYFHKGKVRVLLFDEILIEINNSADINMNFNFIKELNAKIKSMGILINAGIFILEKIEPYDYYVRKYSNGTIKFKHIPRQYLPQVYKYYFNMPVDDLDLLVAKGQRAKVLKFE